MKFFCSLVALALGTIATPVYAAAEFLEEAGGWRVYKDTGTCYMVGRYVEDTTLTVFADGGDDATFWLQNKLWQSLNDGQKYDIDVEFDSMGEWNISATARSDNDGPGLIWTGNIEADSGGDTFLGEFAVARQMRVRRNGRQIDGLNLTGTYEGSMALGRCMGSLPKGDPFAEDSRTDPFAEN